MIQRIQSLYLLLTAFVALLFINGEYLTFFNNDSGFIKLKINGLFTIFAMAEPEKVANVWIISFLVIIIPLLSLSSIFLFSKRKIQMTLTKVLIALIVIFIGATCYYSIKIISAYNATFFSWAKVVIPVIQLQLAVLALLGMKHDDELVKSYDRLR